MTVVVFLKTLRMPVMDGNPIPQEEGSPRVPNPGALGIAPEFGGGKDFSFDKR